jgi:hypothetical protein
MVVHVGGRGRASVVWGFLRFDRTRSGLQGSQAGLARRTTYASGHWKGRALLAADPLGRASFSPFSEIRPCADRWPPSCRREKVRSLNRSLGLFTPDFSSRPDMLPPWDALASSSVKSAVCMRDSRGLSPRLGVFYHRGRCHRSSTSGARNAIASIFSSSSLPTAEPVLSKLLGLSQVGQVELGTEYS